MHVYIPVGLNHLCNFLDVYIGAVVVVIVW